MSVEFNEGGYNYYPVNNQEKVSKISTFLINKGVAKDAKTANLIQIIASIVFFGISLYLMIF